MESRPNVLMIIDWYLPGYRAGGPIRSCANLVAHLGGDIDFHILCSDRDYQSESPYPGITTNHWVTGPQGEQVMYVSSGRMSVKFIHELIKSQGFEQVYIHGLFSSRFSVAPLRALKAMDIPVILAPRGMLRSSAIGLKSTKKRIFLKLAKLNGLFNTVHFHATDGQEASDIKKWISAKAHISIASNLPRELTDQFDSINKEPGSLRLIFAGRVAPEKNLAFALEVLTQIQDYNIVLDIYGAVYDQDYLSLCHTIIGQLSPCVQVTFHDPIPSDQVSALLKTYHALFLPTRGENFGHIILESFMAGRPVLISDQTPWQGLEAEGVGFDLQLGTPEKFAQRMAMWADMGDSAYQLLCQQSFDKAKHFCTNPRLIAASKALFLPA